MMWAVHSGAVLVVGQPAPRPPLKWHFPAILFAGPVPPIQCMSALIPARESLHSRARKREPRPHEIGCLHVGTESLLASLA